MKPTKIGKDIVLPAILAIYLYLLVKAILFKFGPIEVDYLIERLQHNWSNPNDILKRFHAAGNIVPFKEITRDMNHTIDLRQFPPDNLIGNIEAFIPLGILVPLVFLSLRRAWASMFWIAFFLSGGFEVTQLILSIGTFDVDDVILNVTGAMIGYTLFRLFTLRVKTSRPVAAKLKDSSRKLESIKE